MNTAQLDIVHLLDRASTISRMAGEAIMAVYAEDFVVSRKEDASPVTEADRRAEALILPLLAEAAPGIPVISEEEASAGRIPAVDDCYWLVDPLDGTREFIKRNGEFTVNIALIMAGVPILGVVYAPALGRLFAGAQGHGAWLEEAGSRRAIACRIPPAAGLTVVASRSHGDAAALDDFLGKYTVAAQTSVGSSLKFCLVAEGCADLYPRLGRTMEWDTAAGHAVLLAAGGSVRTLHGEPLRYGKAGLDNPHFLASGA